MFFRLRRDSTAAAAAPNRIIIGGAGTGVPLLEPCQPLDDPDEDPLEEPLVDELDELLPDDEPEVLELVEVVMLPELDPLVDTPLLEPLLLPDDEPDELPEDDEELPLDPEDEPLLPDPLLPEPP